MYIYNYKYKKYKSKYKSLLFKYTENKLQLKKTKLKKDIECNINKKYKKLLDPIYFGGPIPKKMKLLQKFKKIVICTYNIWSNEKLPFSKLSKRLPYIVDEIIRVTPDIICLQEMSQQAIDYFKSRKEIISEYYFFEQKSDLKQNGIPFILSKHKPRSVYKYMLETDYDKFPFVILEFPNLLIINVQLYRNDKPSPRQRFRML